MQIANLNWKLHSLLRNALQVGKSRLKILADHLVHAEKHAHDLEHVGLLSVHGPSNVGGIALMNLSEFSGIMRLKRLKEIQLDRDLGRWRALDDLHSSLADFFVSFPFVDGARSTGGAAVSPFQSRVQFLPGRP